MDKNKEKLTNLLDDLKKAISYFFDKIKTMDAPVNIYTHLDADGLSSGAILGKALYRERIPFQITAIRQLEKEEITKISKKVQEVRSNGRGI